MYGEEKEGEIAKWRRRRVEKGEVCEREENGGEDQLMSRRCLEGNGTVCITGWHLNLNSFHHRDQPQIFIQRDFSIVVHLIRRWLHIQNTNTNMKLLVHLIGFHGIQNTNTNTKLLMHLINSWMLARLTHQGKVERWRRENLLRLMFRPWFSPCLTLSRVKIVFKQSDPV